MNPKSCRLTMKRSTGKTNCLPFSLLLKGIQQISEELLLQFQYRPTLLHSGPELAITPPDIEIGMSPITEGPGNVHGGKSVRVGFTSQHLTASENVSLTQIYCIFMLGLLKG
jgi:hypothetical protein